MFQASNRIGQIATPIVLLFVGLASAAGYWFVKPTQVDSSASATHSVVLPLNYNEARTQLVRGNFSADILASCGCEIASREVLEREVDLSADSRPLLNALLRRSKSQVRQRELLTVRAPDDSLGTDHIQLLQTSLITSKGFSIESELAAPAGILRDYRCTIKGVPNGEVTELSFSNSADISTAASSAVHSMVHERVQATVEKSLADQSAAFVAAFNFDDRSE